MILTYIIRIDEVVEVILKKTQNDEKGTGMRLI